MYEVIVWADDTEIGERRGRCAGRGATEDEAVGQLPGDLQWMAAEAIREAHIQPDGRALVDRPHAGWWASATVPVTP